jgi:hypothetical protein
LEHEYLELHAVCGMCTIPKFQNFFDHQSCSQQLVLYDIFFISWCLLPNISLVSVHDWRHGFYNQVLVTAECCKNTWVDYLFVILQLCYVKLSPNSSCVFATQNQNVWRCLCRCKLECLPFRIQQI